MTNLYDIRSSSQSLRLATCSSGLLRFYTFKITSCQNSVTSEGLFFSSSDSHPCWTRRGYWHCDDSSCRQVRVPLRVVLAEVSHVWCHVECHRPCSSRRAVERGAFTALTVPASIPRFMLTGGFNCRSRAAFQEGSERGCNLMVPRGAPFCQGGF